MDIYDILATIGICVAFIIMVILIWWLYRLIFRNSGTDRLPIGNSTHSIVSIVSTELPLNQPVSEETSINDAVHYDYGSANPVKDVPKTYFPILRSKNTNNNSESFPLHKEKSGSKEVLHAREISDMPIFEEYRKEEKTKFSTTHIQETLSNDKIPEYSSTTNTTKFINTHDVHFADLDSDTGKINNVDETGPMDSKIQKIETSDSTSEINFDTPNQEIERILSELEEIQNEADTWAHKILEFDGNEKSFLHIREMLLRGIDAVDLINTDGNDAIKLRKRLIIANIQSQIVELESKKLNSVN